MTGAPAAGTATLVRSYGWLLGVAALVLVADQITKTLVVAQLELNQSVPLVGTVVSFTHRMNTGGAFSVMEGQRLLLCVVSGTVAAGLILIGPRLAGGNRLILAGLGMVLGGAAGNLVDRLRLGHVVDFIDLHFWPVFNVADIGITVGALLIVLTLIATMHQEDDDATAPPPKA
jgi:signal peptidase II